MNVGQEVGFKMQQIKEDKPLLTITPEQFAYEQGVDKPETRQMALDKFRESYESTKSIFGRYCDLPKDYYTLVSLWTIGTYLHDSFESYPFLYLNAMKGSGKSRVMRLITALAKNGKKVANIKEAVLFRTAKGSTICLDEFEQIGSKELATIRELLNAAYKKGTIVERMRKSMTRDGEMQIVEKFELYSSIVIANIYGMDEVTGDRCLTIIMDKSNSKAIVKLIEDFDTNPIILALKKDLVQLSVGLCRYFANLNINSGWNSYITTKYITTPNNTATLSTLNYTPTLTAEELELFEKIDRSGIEGRDLELFFPILIIANLISKEVLDETLTIAKRIVGQKKIEEFVESKDISLMEFLSERKNLRGSFTLVQELVNEFKLSISYDLSEDRWLTSKWFTRALKRLGLLLKNRRVARGVEVQIDVDKAAQKITSYKELLKENEVKV